MLTVNLALSAMAMLLAFCHCARGQDANPAKLTPDVLRTSLHLGTQFLLNNQKPAGNFEYLYDWKRQQYSDQDEPVRQAGVAWGLSLIHAFKPAEEVDTALRKALDFMNDRSRLCDDGSRYIVYPGAKRGSAGTVALVALAHIEYLRSRPTSDPRCQEYQPFLEGYLKYLMRARRDDGQWSAYYDVLTGKPLGDPSPYFDGEALLALVKAAKYLGFEDWKAELLASAQAGYERNVVQAREREPNSPTTKGYYQWGSMAFYELAASGWDDTEVFADYVIELADWVIDIHQNLRRPRNTAYTFEGILHAYQLAKLRQDQPHLEKFAGVIELGLGKLTSWQVGSPIANAYVRGAPLDDTRSLGGIQNHASEPLLRIDVAQHQMHAVILTLKYYMADAVESD